MFWFCVSFDISSGPILFIGNFYSKPYKEICKLSIVSNVCFFFSTFTPQNVVRYDVKTYKDRGLAGPGHKPGPYLYFLILGPFYRGPGPGQLEQNQTRRCALLYKELTLKMEISP